MGFPIPELTLQKDPLLGFRFLVTFLIGGVVPNPLDLRFQKVRGLKATVRTKTISEGGQNLYVQKVPEGVEYENLVLERGMVIGSPLNIEFNIAMSLFKFSPSNVLVFLMNADKVPVAGWTFFNAYPVSWATSDLDAQQKVVVIDTLELAYSRMQIVRI
jgi:phage tail-like protein